MIIKQRKGIIALIIIMLIFLAAVIFVSADTLKLTANAASNDVEYTITVQGEGSVTAVVGNNESEFTDIGGALRSNQTVIFYPAEYFEFLVSVSWSGDFARINGTVINETDYTYTTGGNYITYLSIQPGEGISEISVEFVLKEIEYNINSSARYISNSVLSENDDANLSTALLDGSIVIGLDKEKVKLGDEVTIRFTDTSGLSHRFYDYALLNKLAVKSPYEFQGLSDDDDIHETTITITKEFLDKYLLAENEIVIFGAFIKTFSVKITDYVDDSYSGNFIEATITNGFSGYNETLTSFSADAIKVDEGSYIKLTTLDIPYFTFDGFLVAEGPGDFDGIISYLNTNCEITVEFSKKEYFLIVDGQNNFNIPINIKSGLTRTVNDSDTDKFSIGDIIRIDLSSGLLDVLKNQGLYDNYFTVKVGALYEFTKLAEISGANITVTESSLQITITKEFLDRYLNRNNETIKIFANFSLRYTFSITVTDNTGLENSYTVSVGGGAATVQSGNYTPSNPFNHGTIITIVLNPAKYAAFNLGNVYTANELQGNTITIELNNENRNIVIRFVNAIFNIKDTTEFEGYTANSNNNSRSLEGLSIGNTITISVDIADNDEIKSWILKGTTKDYNVLNGELSEYGAEYANGSLRITLSEKWLNEFGYNLKSEVSTGFKTSLLIAIIVPSVVVPILIIILLIIFITNAKRKKFIKAELLEEKMAGYTYNAGSMIEDLRDDSFNKVSKEEVKAEMKKKKKH